MNEWVSEWMGEWVCCLWLNTCCTHTTWALLPSNARYDVVYQMCCTVLCLWVYIAYTYVMYVATTYLKRIIISIMISFEKLN